jgi:plastocyanin
VRRAALGLAVVLLAAGLLVVIDGDHQAGAATTCVKHTKRIVKHVKRHGKWHRVVRIKHYWTCQETGSSGSATTTTTTSPGSGSGSGSTPTPEPESNALSVTANDLTNPYEYVPSHRTVKAGKLTVQLNDIGEDEHNMDMVRVGPGGEAEGPIIVAVSAESKNHSTPKTVEVQAGTYKMWCTLPGHAAKGMETTITVE